MPPPTPSDPIKPFSCPICKKGYATAKGKRYHVKIFHEKATDFKCSHCDLLCETALKLIVHERIHSGEKPFGCKFCEMRFISKGYVRSHFLNVHAEKKFKCVPCKKAYGMENNLKRHLATHSGEKPFQCENCSAKFGSKETLKRHRLNVHEKKFKCVQCDMEFGRETGLKKHLIVHTGMKCDQRGKSFSKRDDLKQHLKEQLKPFDCKDCGKRFKEERRLQKHLPCISTFLEEIPAQCSLVENHKESGMKVGQSNDNSGSGSSGGARYNLRSKNGQDQVDREESNEVEYSADESDDSQESDSESSELDEEGGSEEVSNSGQGDRIEMGVPDETASLNEDPVEGSDSSTIPLDSKREAKQPAESSTEALKSEKVNDFLAVHSLLSDWF